MSAMADLAAPALAQATPLLLAGLGGVLSERAGIVNIALEGMMLAGAFVGIGVGITHGAPLGVAAALATGVVLGLLHLFMTQRLRVNHIVSGLGINILAINGTTFLLRRLFENALPMREPRLPATLPTWPFIMLALLLPFAVHGLLYGTAWGLRLRAVGESPADARMAGVAPFRLRASALALSGMLGALAGAFLSVAQVGRFSDDMVSGRGYIALAAVICGRWTPLGMAGIALVFGLFEALQIRLQGTVALPSEALRSLPYVVTIAAAILFRSYPPAALGVTDSPE